VLKSEGYLVRVLPNASHLIEMRRIIYSEIDVRDKAYEKNIPENVISVHKEDIAYEIHLDREGIKNLFKMTPHYWRATLADKDILESHHAMSLTVDMALHVYQKKKN